VNPAKLGERIGHTMKTYFVYGISPPTTNNSNKS
jgi:hypothetical protein